MLLIIIKMLILQKLLCFTHHKLPRAGGCLNTEADLQEEGQVDRTGGQGGQLPARGEGAGKDRSSNHC